MNLASRFNSPALQRRQRVINRFSAAAFCIALMLFSPFVVADELSDTRQLLNAGRLNEALAAADSYLSQRPHDAHMLFLKGLILTEQNQSAKAIDVFTQLTAQYPTLPEPYNNLAVLYASSGQFDKARVALEASIRTNPSYATAHENLGDLYAKMASQAYDKALQINSNNTAAKTKLAMLNSLTGDTTAAASAQPVSRASASSVASAASMASAASAASVASAVVPSVSASASKPAAVSKPASVAAVSKPAPAPQPEPKPATVAAQKSANQPNHDEVARTLSDWAAAWSARDVKKYLGFYANDFHLPKGKTRKAWTDERNSRIASKRQINVKVESPQITFSGNTATVKFRQSYKADRLSVSSKKTIVFVKSGGKWKIQQELAGN